MTIISTREFRANQGKYLNMVAQGQEVVLKSRDHGSFRISLVMEDDTLMRKTDFLDMVDKRIAEHEKNPSKAIVVGEDETADELLKRIVSSCTE